jgi:hypothetical protein
MYLSMITIENFRCFGGGPSRFELPLRPGRITFRVRDHRPGTILA